MSLSELKEHIHTLPEQPDLIPYRTSYYSESWGFCMEHEKLQALEDGDYVVRIDSSLEPGGPHVRRSSSYRARPRPRS